MITEFGMSNELGPITFGHKQEQVFLGRDYSKDRNYSEEIANAIDKEVRNLIGKAYRKAEDLLNTNMDKLNLIAEVLMKKETIEAAEFEALMKGESIETVKNNEPTLVIRPGEEKPKD
jgi:cell division protease FtsH